MNVVIVHGITDDEKDNPLEHCHWIAWIKDELSKEEIEVSSPLMPRVWNPDYLKWKKEFEKNKIDEKTLLIGHSGGCSFLVRWLGETKKKIKKLILVAPWKIPSEEFSDGENELYDFEIDKSIKDRVKEVIIFTSDDDEEDGKESARIYYDSLGGKVIELKGYGHFIEEDMVTKEFPELLEEVLK